MPLPGRIVHDRGRPAGPVVDRDAVAAGLDGDRPAGEGRERGDAWRVRESAPDTVPRAR